MADKKRSPRLDWEDLRVLLELARHGSLSATAREMGVTHATVGRRLSNLEADLAQPLFVREGGRFVLTEAGKRILDLARPMEASALSVLRAASSLEAKLTGPVRITATEAVAAYLVVPALGRIREQYPDIELTLNISQINLNLARSDADIAVRLGAVADGTGLIDRTVADIDYHLYGARAYLASRSKEQWDYLGYPEEYAEWPEYKTFQALIRNGNIALRLNHLGNRIAATRAGLGIALLPRIMAEAWPELVRCSDGPAAMTRQVHLVVHEDLKDVERIRCCYDVLVEAVASLAR